MKDNPKIDLEVQGHTDNVGSDGYNMNLSQQRADSVRATSCSTGSLRVVDVEGLRLDQPLVPNDTPANRQLNRRVQFIRVEAGAQSPPSP